MRNLSKGNCKGVGQAFLFLSIDIILITHSIYCLAYVYSEYLLLGTQLIKKNYQKKKKKNIYEIRLYLCLYLDIVKSNLIALVPSYLYWFLYFFVCNRQIAPAVILFDIVI